MKNKYVVPKSFVFFFFLGVSISLKAQVSGRVFQDYNGNGVYDTNKTITAADGGTQPVAIDKGVSGIIVTAYSAAGASVGTSTTIADGTYSIAAASGSVRVEFTGLPTDYYSGPVGTNNATSVQFVTAPATNINLGINRPYDYSEDNPLLATNCFLPFSNTGTNASGDVLVTVLNSAGSTAPYNNGIGCLGGPCPPSNNLPTPTHLATHGQIGTTYGLGWQRSKKMLFAATYVKQFSDVGPLGTGAIYRVDMSNPSSPVVASGAVNTPTGHIDLNAIFGANTMGANPFSPYPDFTTTAGKQTVGDAVYNTAFSDIDVSADDKKLFALSYKDKKIYNIPIDGSAINATTVKSASVPVISGAVDVRPTAIGMKDGKVYVVVGSGYTINTANSYDPDAYARYDYYNGDNQVAVYEYDPVANTFAASPILSFTWRFPNGGAWLNYAGGMHCTDLIFDDSGAMVIATREISNDPLGGTQGGRLLRACKNSSGVYELELQGSCGGITTGGSSYGGGYADGVYYYQVNPVDGGIFDSNGGLVQLPGHPYLIETAYDTYIEYSAGLRWLTHADGKHLKGMEIVPYNSPTPIAGVPWDNKAGVLGELEALSTAAPIEIGNRVWIDTDDDGIQDAGETGISGLTVTLCLASAPSTAVATATTDANGNYYFSSAVGTSTASAKYGVNLAYETAYILKFPTTSSGKAISTKPNTGGNDLIDSDASVAGQIAFTTGTMGQNNHTFDVGYATAACVPPTATASATQPLCTGTNAPNNGGITIAAFTAGQRYQYTSGGAFTGTATPASITAIPAGGVITSTLANTSGSYTVRIYDATDDACFVDRVITITAVVCCTNPVAGTPVVTQATCNAAGTAANNDASISISGITNATVYAYTTDGSTPAFAGATAVSGGAINLTALANPSSALTYKFRIFNGSATCFTDVTATLNPKTCSPTCTNPTAGTPVVTQATCNAAGTAANNDASIAISGITNATVYAYTTDGSTPAFAGATAVSGGAINLTALANPAAATTYKFRIFNGSATCYTDVTATLNPKTCSPTCTNPTAGTPVVTQATCNAAGTAANNDASIAITGITNATVYAYTTDGSTPAFAGATAVSGGAINLTALANPAAATTYKFRIFNGSATCFTDVTATLNPKTCSPTCTAPNAGADMTICLPKTSLNLTDAASGTEWVAVSGNPATAIINATTGVITGMTVTGTYKFRLQKTGDATCSDEMQVIVTAGDAVIMLCNDGSTSYTLLAQAGYTNIIWYNMAGVQVGTGTSLIVKSTTLGLEDGSEAYYYEGTNSTDGCAGELCCPVKFMTQSCCPVPNCKTVTVIKNVK